MIAFDTNHLLRHVLDDDPKQCKLVHALIKSATTADEQIYVCDLVLVEACWVLQSGMGFNREGWCYILDEILQDPVFCFDNANRLWKALERYKSGKADFSDYLILGYADSVSAKLQTFDKKLKREL